MESTGVRLRRPDWVAAVAIVGWLCLFHALSWLKFASFHNHSFDLALYVRSAWGAAHGAPINTLLDRHLLAIHLHPVLYLVAPLARLVSVPELLLALQSLALAGGALALYVIARRRLEHGWAPLVVLLCYLCYPTVGNTWLFDFHPKVLALPLLLLGYDRLDRRGARDVVAWVLLALALSCREEVALQAAFVGLGLVVFRRGRRGASLGLLVGGAVIFALYFVVVRDLLGSSYRSEEVHFAHLLAGDGWSIAAGVGQRLVWPGLKVALVMLAPLLLLPLLVPHLALAAFPIWAVVALSGWPDIDHPASHYPFLAAPYLLLALVLALERIEKRRPRVLRYLLPLLALAALGGYLSWSQGPLGAGFDRQRYRFDQAATDAARCLEPIPAKAAVMAPVHVVAHLASRETVHFELSERIAARIDFALLDVDPIPWTRLGPEHGARRGRQMKILLQHRGFVVERRCGPYRLLRRARSPSRSG